MKTKEKKKIKGLVKESDKLADKCSPFQPEFITQFEISQLLHSFAKTAYEKHGVFNLRPRFLIKTPEVRNLPQGKKFLLMANCLTLSEMLPLILVFL